MEYVLLDPRSSYSFQGISVCSLHPHKELAQHVFILLFCSRCHWSTVVPPHVFLTQNNSAWRCQRSRKGSSSEGIHVETDRMIRLIK